MSKSSAKLIRAFVAGCLAFGIVGSLCAALAIPLDQMLFPQSAASAAGTASHNGPLLVAAFLVALAGAVVIFLYGMAPEAAIWNSVRRRLERLRARRGGG